MSGALKLIVSVCDKIQKVCGVKDWQKATEEQLKLRDNIHNSIYIMSDVVKNIHLLVKSSIDKNIRLKKEIKKSKEKYEKN